MSRIDDLIAAHCPNGVEFKELGAVGQFIRGRRFTKDDIVPEGIGSIHYGEIYTHYGTSTTSVLSQVRSDLKPQLRFAQPADVIIAAVGETVEDVCKAVAWLGDREVAVHDDCFIYRHSMNPAFVSYCFQTADFHAQKNRHVARAKVKRISGESLAKLKIAMPPLEVQSEIVKILDSFIKLKAELEVELEAELEARRRQYACCRDALLTFEDSQQASGIRWTSLGDICKSVTSGGTPLSTRSDYYSGDIPWLRTQEVRYADVYDTEVKITARGLDESSAKWIPENCVIVAISGASAARSAVNKIPLTTNQHCCNLEIDPEQASFRYVFHWICNEYKKLKALGQGPRADLNAGIIKGYPIAIPSLTEQARITAILDRFEALMNELSTGLPAELAARRKQYEYYRDRLLTFRGAA